MCVCYEKFKIPVHHVLCMSQNISRIYCPLLGFRLACSCSWVCWIFVSMSFEGSPIKCQRKNAVSKKRQTTKRQMGQNAE
jgi:hypothetical protein